jgi:hypothetical protein
MGPFEMERGSRARGDRASRPARAAVEVSFNVRYTEVIHESLPDGRKRSNWGRRAVPLLVRQGHSVTAAVRTAEKRKAVEGQGAKAAEVSLFDTHALRRALEGYDVVVNLATHMPASATRMLLPGAWTENDRIRREGSRSRPVSRLGKQP